MRLAVWQATASALIVLTGAGWADAGARPAYGLSATRYIRTIDGDTIVATGSAGEQLTVRLRGIDTPELDSGGSAAFLAAYAVAAVLEQAPRVYLERDPADPLDKYGRTLAWVWVEDAGGRWGLGQALLDEGLAGPYFGGARAPPAGAALAAPADAGASAQVAPQAGDADVTVYVTKTGEKYHRDGCRYLKKSKIAVTLKWAKEHGYKPCKVCKPPV